MGAVAFALHLLALGQHGFGAPQPNGDVLAADTLHRTVDQLALAPAKVLEQVLALGLADALEQDLLGRLGGNATEALGGTVDHDHVAQLGRCVAFLAGGGQGHFRSMVEHVVDDLFLGEDSRLAGARVDLDGDALIAAQVRVTPVGRNKGRLQRFEDVLFGQTPCLTDFIKSQDKFALHGTRSNLFSFCPQYVSRSFRRQETKKVGVPTFPSLAARKL